MKSIITILLTVLISISVKADESTMELKGIGDKLRVRASSDMNYLDSQERKIFFEYVNDAGLEKAFTLGRKYLEIHPYDISAHYAMIGVSGQLGNDKEYSEHFMKYFALLYSIVSSSDGSSSESAYKVFNRSEMMITLNEFGCEPGPQDSHGEFIHITCSSKGRSGLKTMIFKIQQSIGSNQSLKVMPKNGTH